MAHVVFNLPALPAAACLVISTNIADQIYCISLVCANNATYVNYFAALGAEMEANGGQNLDPPDHATIHTTAEAALGMGAGTTLDGGLHFHWVWVYGDKPKPFPAPKTVQVFTTVAKKTALAGGFKGMVVTLAGANILKT